MTLRTGKTGRYRYYTCSTCARQGKSACEGRSIPMDKLDRLVTDRLADRLLTPERVGDLLAGLMERQAAKNEDHATRLTALRAKISDVESRLGRLYAAIESGLADLNDQTLKDRVAAVKTERDLAQIAYDRAVAETNPRARITDEKIAAFVETMRSNVLTGDTPFRRAYIRSVIDQVEVDDDEIRIWGRKGVLERLVAASGGSGRRECPVLFGIGAPDRIRTCGLCLRRATLYPAELRAHRMLADSAADDFHNRISWRWETPALVQHIRDGAGLDLVIVCLAKRGAKAL